jgi:membrane-associated phospholipid phosphatase
MNHSLRWQDVVACLLAIVVIVFTAHFIDQPLALLLQAYDQQNPGRLQIIKDLTDLGKSHWYLVPTGVIALFCFGGAAMAKNNPARQARLRKIAYFMAFIFACIAVSGLVVDLLKMLFGRARPSLLDGEGIFEWAWFATGSQWASFPSGHSNTVFALALALTALLPRWKIPLLIFAVLVAGSRVVIAAHFLSDILGGALVASITTAWLIVIFNRRGWLKIRA